VFIPGKGLHNDLPGTMAEKQTGLLGLVAGAAAGSVESFVTYVRRRERSAKQNPDPT
jgi:hypothetical protein